MVAEALQINYSKEEYALYKKLTKNNRARQLGFLFALFKLKMNNHIQCVFSGEYGQGKTSSAMITAKWETKYVKILLKWYEKMGILDNFEHLKNADWRKIHFGVQNNIIISPEDPASKYIYSPLKLNSYLIDDGYFFTSTGEANTTATRKITKSITGNRKMNPSMYWVFPNIFKIPTAILETMDVWIHKETLKTADVIIPSRVIQLKEKFAKERVERYARYPKAFKHLIRLHPSFISKVRYPAVKGESWIIYNNKYEKYKWKDTDNIKERDNPRITFFKQLEKVLNKEIRVTTTAKAREELIHTLIENALKKKSNNTIQATQVAHTFTEEYIKWEEEKLASQLTKELSNSLLENTEVEITQ